MTVWNRSLSDDAEQPADASPASGEPGYTFEGFKVDFSEKVMLTPWDQDGKKKSKERREA